MQIKTGALSFLRNLRLFERLLQHKFPGLDRIVARGALAYTRSEIADFPRPMRASSSDSRIADIV